VKQAALYRKTEPEVRLSSELDKSRSGGAFNEDGWSVRRRFAFLIAAALASWAVVGLVGYGVYILFA
jgi:hypothetical protein